MPLVPSTGSRFRRIVTEGGLLVLGAGMWLVAVLHGLLQRTRAALVRLISRLVAFPSDPRVRRAAAGVSRWLFGRRRTVATATVLIAPLAALAGNVWAATVGYATLTDWLWGTWTGADPQMTVFLAGGVILALAAAAGAARAGLLPTTLLAAAPVGGIAFTRYGTTVHSHGPVGLPEATGLALAIGVLVGLPLGVGGYLLGLIGRRLAESVSGTRSTSTRSGDV